MNWSELHITDDTVKLIKELQKRKAKLERLKAELKLYIAVTVICGSFFALFFYQHVLLSSKGNAIAILDLTFSNAIVKYTLVGTIALALIMNNHVTRIGKAKKKYENLRFETIDKLDWIHTMRTDVRDQISAELKEQYDINIIYKS